MAEYNEAEALVVYADYNCDAGRGLQRLLELLLAADLDDHCRYGVVDEDFPEDEDAKEEALHELWKIADSFRKKQRKLMHDQKP